MAGSLGAAFGVAAVGGGTTAESVRGWYQTLQKPPWNPPDWIFGPVWSVLYAQMAVAAWLVWRTDRPGTDRQGTDLPSGAAAGGTLPALGTYAVQLLLNLGWSLVFFGLRRPGLALIEISVLWVAIVLTVAQFRRRSRWAALLLLPYLAWVTFAVTLNVEIWRRNR